MRIHHLNTGTMCPIGRRLVNGTGSIFQRARMVCHCLLIETNDGLALVDTGLKLDDIAQPHRLGRRWVRQTAPRLDPAETAFQQVKALGYSPNDVRHLLLTHLDRDHAGGGQLEARVEVEVTAPDADVDAKPRHRQLRAATSLPRRNGELTRGRALRANAR